MKFEKFTILEFEVSQFCRGAQAAAWLKQSKGALPKKRAALAMTEKKREARKAKKDASTSTMFIKITILKI